MEPLKVNTLTILRLDYNMQTKSDERDVVNQAPTTSLRQSEYCHASRFASQLPALQLEHIHLLHQQQVLTG